MKNKLAVVLDLVEDGSRLAPLTNHRPLASIPFDGRYRLIDFAFSSMRNAELTSTALFISGSGQSLYDHIRSGSIWGLDSDIGGGVFTYSHIDQKLYTLEDEEDKKRYFDNHRKYIERTYSKEVLVAGSQILFNIDLRELKAFHRAHEEKITAVYKPLEAGELPQGTNVKSYILSDGGQNLQSIEEITDAMIEKNERINAGTKMVLLDTDFMMSFLDWAQENMILVSAESALEYALSVDENISSFEYDGYYASIETIESYYKASMDMLDEDKFRQLFFCHGQVITRPHDGAPSYFAKDSKVRKSHLATNCDIYGDVSSSILFRNIFVGENAQVEGSIVMSSATVEEGAVVKNAILDKNVVIKAGVSVIGDADQPLVIKKDTVVSEDIKA